MYSTEIAASTAATSTTDRAESAEGHEEAAGSEAGGSRLPTARLTGDGEGVMTQNQGGEAVVGSEGEFPVNGGGLIYLQEGDGEGRLIQVGFPTL